MKTQENINGVKVPSPNDRRYSFAMYFNDYFPRVPKLKFSLRGVFSDGLPVTAPGRSRDEGCFRSPAVDATEARRNLAETSRQIIRIIRSRL